MKTAMLALRLVLVTTARQTPGTARSEPGEVTTSAKQFVDLLTKAEVVADIADWILKVQP